MYILIWKMNETKVEHVNNFFLFQKNQLAIGHTLRLDTYFQYSTFNLPPNSNDYKANKDAATYIYLEREKVRFFLQWL